LKNRMTIGGSAAALIVSLIVVSTASASTPRELVALVASTATSAAPHSTAGSSYPFFKVKSPVARGQLAHVVEQGRTGLCRITVSKAGIQMHLGPSPRVNPLRAKLSGPGTDNRVAWEWWVPANTPIGLWRVRVNCGRAATLQGTFLVTR
jgi:hypothetical protein